MSMVGPPGAGKTMLASRLPGILPELDDAEALEVTAIHSVAGTLPDGAALIRCPPLQVPHHTATVASLVGGGSGLARPGAVSLAHRGILLLDEAAEFQPAALEALRQPLESGRVVLHRSGGAVTYPARFLLVMAANPCPCAAPRSRDCVCVSTVRRRYQQRLSGPLRDRIDLRLDVDPVARADLADDSATGESSAAVAARVASARQASRARWRRYGHGLNSEVPGIVLRRPPYRPDTRALRSLDRAVEQGMLTARGYHRTLRVPQLPAYLMEAHRSSSGSDVGFGSLF